MAIGYSREEMERMQSDAIRRVRDMQQRAQRAVNPETPYPGAQTGHAPRGNLPGIQPGPFPHPPRPVGAASGGRLPPAPKPPSKGFNLLNMLNLKSLHLGSDTLLVLMVFLLLSSEECDELLLLALLYIIL